MVLGYVTKISPDGQVTIPEEARERWGAGQVVIVDFGDRVVMRPVSEDPIGDIQKKYRGRIPNTDEMRRQDRAEEAEDEDRQL